MREFEFEAWQLPLEEQIDHLETLDDLLEKQQILYTRMKLSDDPRAMEMADNVRKSAIVMGFPKDVDCNLLFSNMRETLNRVRKGIDKGAWLPYNTVTQAKSNYTGQIYVFRIA